MEINHPPPPETKNKLKNTEQIEIETNSTSTIKKQEQLIQKAQAPIGQAGRVYDYTKVNSEKPRGAFRLPPAKFNTVASASTKSSKGMNKQCNAEGSTKSLQRSYSIESMDCDTDGIVASLDLEGITNNYNT